MKNEQEIIAKILEDTKKRGAAFTEVMVARGTHSFKRITDGEDFTAVAKRFSSCPSRKNGGDLGWFGKGVMAPEFEQAAFAADAGKVVGPVKTQFGYHVIKVTGKK